MISIHLANKQAVALRDWLAARGPDSSGLADSIALQILRAEKRAGVKPDAFGRVTRRPRNTAIFRGEDDTL